MQKNLLKYCVRSGAIWCHCRHLSKVNCFDRWTTKFVHRQEASDYKSISVSSHTQTTSQTWGNFLKFSPFYQRRVRRIHTWLRNPTTERLSHLAVIAMHTNAVTIDRSVVCKKFVALYPRRMTASSFWPTRLIRCSINFISSIYGVSRVCSVTVSSSSSLNRHVLGQK